MWLKQRPAQPSLCQRVSRAPQFENGDFPHSKRLSLISTYGFSIYKFIGTYLYKYRKYTIVNISELTDERFGQGMGYERGISPQIDSQIPLFLTHLKPISRFKIFSSQPVYSTLSLLSALAIIKQWKRMLKIKRSLSFRIFRYFYGKTTHAQNQFIFGIHACVRALSRGCVHSYTHTRVHPDLNSRPYHRSAKLLLEHKRERVDSG